MLYITTKLGLMKECQIDSIFKLNVYHHINGIKMKNQMIISTNTKK